MILSIRSLAHFPWTLLPLLVGCQGRETVGTNTNWFSACRSDSDCKVGSCVCGACTTVCSQDEDCGVARCGSSDEHPGSTCSVPLRMCLAPEFLAITGDCEGTPLRSDGDLATYDSSCQGDELVCESLNSLLPASASTWSQGSIHEAIQSCYTRDGTPALHYQSRVGDGWSQSRFRLPDGYGSELHTRFYFFLPENAPVGDYLVLSELWPGLEIDNATKLSVQLRPKETVQISIGPASALTAESPERSFTRQAWHCLEWSVVLATTNTGSVEVKIDGNSVINVEGQVTQATTPPIVSTLEGVSTPDLGVDIVLDDFIVSKSAIGCD